MACTQEPMFFHDYNQINWIKINNKKYPIWLEMIKIHKKMLMIIANNVNQIAH